jgi:hypothetical protein
MDRFVKQYVVESVICIVFVRSFEKMLICIACVRAVDVFCANIVFVCDCHIHRLSYCVAFWYDFVSYVVLVMEYVAHFVCVMVAIVHIVCVCCKLVLCLWRNQLTCTHLRCLCTDPA